ncbi:MAG: hypothetical protein MRJ93_12990 [Nitrososphaeraceae archaeon]|nr:hypothetical protein [Nitrososphaeraceae archaeon]
MPGFKKRRDYFTSITDNYYSSDPEDKRYCVHCESFGFPYKELKPRVYQPHEYINGQIPQDSENFLQCYECGTIYPVEHGKQESTIAGFKEVPETIHDSKRLKVEHFVKPRHNRNNNSNRKVRREPEELDDFIKDRIDRGNTLISYSDNSADLE